MVAADNERRCTIESDLEQIVTRYKERLRRSTNAETVSRVEVDGDCFALVRIPGGDRQKLSKRQMEIARLIGSGYGNKGIARQLNLSESTVSHHLSAIYRKWGLQSRAELARMALILLGS